MKNSIENFTFCISGAPNPAVVCPPESLDVGKALGEICAQHNIDIMTISTTGFSLWVSLAAMRAGSTTIAFSPASSYQEHTEVFRYPTEGFSHLVYTGFGTSGASVLALRSSDAVIFGCGGMSSILECITAIEQGKPIGILQGPWDTDNVLRDMLSKNYPNYEHVIVDTDPRRLVEQMMKRVKMIRNA